MTDTNDRPDTDGNGNGGGSFIIGLLAGTVLGAGLGMLFAPKAGSDLRRQFGEQAGNLANNASEKYRKASERANDWAGKAADAAGQFADRAKDLTSKARDAVAAGVDEGRRAMNESARRR